MGKLQPLTDVQRRRLAILEPALRNAARLGKYEEAKRLAVDLQNLLRPTGHETRLLAAKNWLYEAAMEAGNLQIAIAGFIGTRQKTKSSTRLHLEATALLAVCYLRQRDYERAEPLMAAALANEDNIRSPSRRLQFRRRLVDRFEEETLLYALQGDTPLSLDPDDIQQQAQTYVLTKTDDEMFAAVGAAVPPQAVAALLRVHEFARRELQRQSSVALPPAQQLTTKVSLGARVVEASKRVVWRSLCDPESAVYRAWFTGGVAHLMNGKLVAAAIVGTLSGFRLGTYTLVVSVTALIIKMGLEVFCEVWQPRSVMIAREDDSV